MSFRITLERLPLRLDFEIGSIAEGVAILQDQDTEIRKMVAIADELSGSAEGEAGDAPKAGEAPKGRKKRGAADPATAAAPAPTPVPPPAPPAPDLTETANGLPAFLDRTAAAPPVAPPPPPPLPAAPVPPSGVLAGKIIANLDLRKSGAADAGKGLADWLAGCGLCTAGATYDEAISVLRLMADDKLTAIAAQLQVA